MAVGQRSMQVWDTAPGGNHSQMGGTGRGHCVSQGCEHFLCLCGCWYRHGFLPPWSSWLLHAFGNICTTSLPAGSENRQPLQSMESTSLDLSTSSSWLADF